jgi:pilus assembly protein CpaB
MNLKALIAAAVVAVIGVYMLWVYKQRFEAEASGGRKVGVVIVTRDIPIGTKITPERLAVRDLPEDYVEPRHIREHDAQRIVGVRVRTRLEANESILWSDLATAGGDARDLAGLIRPGMRAIAIRATPESSFDGLLRPGDRVDVLLTTNREGSEARMTFPLEQNLLVLATGRDVGGNEGPDGTQRGRKATVTLAATLEQAQILAFGVDRGELTIVLRHPDDIATVEGMPEATVSTIMEPAASKRLRRRARRPKPVEPPPVKEGIERVE